MIGIDPGRTGAISVVHDAPLRVCVHDIPTVNVKVGGKVRVRMDFHRTWELLQGLAFEGPALVLLEDIERGGVRPGQSGGVVFGKIAGALEAFCVALGLPIHLVPPATWKRELRLTSDKDETRLAASRLFPGFAHLWPLVKHDGRAEAALLAWYGITKVLGKEAA